MVIFQLESNFWPAHLYEDCWTSFSRKVKTAKWFSATFGCGNVSTFLLLFFGVFDQTQSTLTVHLPFLISGQMTVAVQKNRLVTGFFRVVIVYNDSLFICWKFLNTNSQNILLKSKQMHREIWSSFSYSDSLLFQQQKSSTISTKRYVD